MGVEKQCLFQYNKGGRMTNEQVKRTKEKETKKLVMKDDIMFKAFFSRAGNEKFLKRFLNAILGEEIKIKKVIHDASGEG